MVDLMTYSDEEILRSLLSAAALSMSELQSAQENIISGQTIKGLDDIAQAKKRIAFNIRILNLMLERNNDDN